MIPYGKQFIDENDIEEVIRVLKSDYLTQGPAIEEFEKDICKYVGSKYAVAVSSGTAALHLCGIIAELSPDNSLVTSPITFVASANMALYRSSNVVFCDIERDTANINPYKLEKLLYADKKIKAVVPVHFAGSVCNMEKISSLCRKFNVSLIEDAAHALGAQYEDGGMVGSCKYSDMTIFSFHPVKSITAGEGGVITTNSEEIYRRLLRLRSHGITKLDDTFINRKYAYSGEMPNPWYYELQEIGYHYRFTDIQAALAKSQLKKLNNFVAERAKKVEEYDNAFLEVEEIELIQKNHRKISSHHLYPILIDFNSLSIDRGQFMNILKNKGIGTQVHYIPVHIQPLYSNMGYQSSDYPEAMYYYERCLSIPLYYSLSSQDQKFVIESIKDIIKSHKRK